MIDNGTVGTFYVTTARQETFPRLRARLYNEPRRNEPFIRKTIVVQGSRSGRIHS
jgi:hypothetical protein